MQGNQEVKEFFHQRGEDVILITEVTKIHDHGGKSQRKLAITDNEIVYFDIKKSQVEILRCGVWFELAHIDQFDENECKLLFNTEILFHFTYKDKNEVPLAINYVIQQLFTNDEQIKLNFSRNHFPEHIPSPRSIFAKFMHIRSLQHIEIPDNDIQKFKLSLMLKKHQINITEYSSNTIPLIINTLQMSPLINEVIINGNNDYPGYKIFSDLIACEGKFSHITIDSVPFSYEFNTAMDILCKFQNHFLTGLTFINTSLGEEELDLLSQAYLNTKMHSLGFHNAIEQSSILKLQTSFLPSLGSTITMLTLDNTLGLNIKSFLNKMPKLNKLSLSGCQLDVIDTINAITSCSKVSLRSLNLNHNQCFKYHEYDLPKTLTTLLINDIKWGPSVFPSFFAKLISFGIPKFRLSVCSIKISSDDWNSTNKIFETSSGENFHTFIWENNKITPQFIIFMKTLFHLQVLSLKSCIISDIPTTIRDLSINIIYLVNLKQFIMSNCELGFETNIILNSLTHLENVEYIDVSFNSIPEECLLMIPQLKLSMEHLQYVIVDGSQMKLETVEKLIAEIISKNFHIIPFPLFDISTLLETGSLSPQKYIDIVRCWKLFDHDNPENTFSHVFEENFEIYSFNKYELFRYYYRTIEESEKSILRSKKIKRKPMKVNFIEQNQINSSPKHQESKVIHHRTRNIKTLESDRSKIEDRISLSFPLPHIPDPSSSKEVRMLEKKYSLSKLKPSIK
ncbi:Leucine Rich Repeat family protein [Trichomonas vaginalis G3]|uniref:Leucine Rich Repeat family protein n=1 Tax=Trichomonas vaginalis (strain ATCC PRA-98 / G3) TaxID=412133 RepID=A2E679_TRIV3|nr:uncharacterized protein TVAGG3_0394170 [Trichomonas vaginalis G3]EAY11802.1 Leucine Rich Repeat family protein [Trichomonas vaginalis G3]KAI5534208.1 ribonuclease inhibitor domain-containing protein [Trichomonas vaginalis G3]|eukprot:XP_001324025.1 hypothetical protein [Trichomonas vaginalis G3]